MTARIPLTALKGLPFDFEQAVKDFVQAKKDHLRTEGVPAPAALRNQINPPLKVKLLGIQYSEALTAELAGKATASDHAVLQAWEDSQQKIRAIDRHVAELESQLHDLPADMVDLWKWAPFPSV